jgi:hypothetical protein
MYISMSYHYSKYEFVGPESDLEWYCTTAVAQIQFIQVSEFFEPTVLVLVCFDGIFREHGGAESDFRRNIPM